MPKVLLHEGEFCVEVFSGLDGVCLGQGEEVGGDAGDAGEFGSGG